MNFVLRVLIGALAAIAVAAAAYRAGSLSKTGALAAALTGTVAVAAGWNWGALLVAYFASSSLLSRLGRARKRDRTIGVIEKAGPRDAAQVTCNGLPFTVLALAWSIGYDPGGGGAVMCAAATSLAASAADTWATEIGTWIGRAPRSIITWRKLAVGQSGGVSAAGLLGSLGGAAFVSGMAASLGWPPNMLATILAGGIIGSLLDSLLGAALQQERWCNACAMRTEMRTHTCGAPTQMNGGLALFDNDIVNLFATTAAALFGLFLAPGIGG